MEKLNISWNGIHDSTGYLFSFAKALSCAVRNSPWAYYAEDIIATSGFAFRMWVAADLCPSATSIWAFGEQPEWLANGGFKCAYVERYWDDERLEAKRWTEAIAIIKESIDNGIPAISWNIGIPEWGLIIGYDDDAEMFATLAINGVETKMPYRQLGKGEIPILSVLTLTGVSGKSPEDILTDTKRLAVRHLQGEEWCENANGLEAYPALAKHFEGEDAKAAGSWEMKYMLGTYGALKYYAWKYFDKMGQTELAEVYQAVYKAWQEAFQMIKEQDAEQPETIEKISALLKLAQVQETKAVKIMAEA